MTRIIAIAAFILFLTTNADARKVSGSVTCGEEKLAGVIVTDGVNFTQTDAKGKFSFHIENDAEAVYIVTPSGYVADWSSGVPAFYRQAPGFSRFDFNLTRTASGNDWHIVAIADPQVYSLEQYAEFSGEPMGDLIKTCKSLDGVAVGLTLGDISWDRIEVLDWYKNDITSVGIPFYPVVGNHDNEAYVQGDKEASATYRSKMGPENYAFFLGKEIVIVLDNIIYDTNFKMTSGYTEDQIEWVRNLVNLIPSDMPVIFAQHVPMAYGKRKIKNADLLLDIVRGRKVTILSGHSHENRIQEIERGVTEHVVAAFCGAWWDTEHCTDGTPRGYKVFTNSHGRFSWYYKSIGKPKNYIAEAFGPGIAVRHPNAVVVSVWDRDPQWLVEWYEDGVYMGKMDKADEISPVYSREIYDAFSGKVENIPGWKLPYPSENYFVAVPDRYAKNVTVSVKSRFGQEWLHSVNLQESIDIQASVSTLEQMKTAIDKGANTLEMQLVTDISGKVYVGSEGGELFSDVLDAVEAYTAEKGCSPVRYHFDLKTLNGTGEGKSYPVYHDCADAVLKELIFRYLSDRSIISSDDWRALNFMYDKYPEFYYSFKPDFDDQNLEKKVKLLAFTPTWLYVDSEAVTPEMLEPYMTKGMMLIISSVNSADTYDTMLEHGAKAIVTDNLSEILLQSRGY